MPQMAPISWLILFIIFSLTFLLFNVVNYFCFNYNKSMTSKNYNQKYMTTNFNWKW
uniref:ATP synthase F0 subunit 8 n=1 Tax=Cricotopus triannulatus TaxID=401642 RepID=UPI002E784F6C|nr:ATP synthase F0 subunit 8 [Cricotopus triannulatus]WPM93195.1 ATP synthase F0 subunit 8 [Cricotopus triannulatus]